MTERSKTSFPTGCSHLTKCYRFCSLAARPKAQVCIPNGFSGKGQKVRAAAERHPESSVTG
jgi:hypothetical protein